MRRAMSVPSGEPSYLCEVFRVTDKYAEMRPLVASDPSRSRWVGVLDQDARDSLFPNTGSLLWFDPPRPPAFRSVWEVRAEPSPTFHADRAGSVRFRAASVTAAIELLDFRSRGGSEAALNVLTVEGLAASRPPSGTSYAWCSATETVGPFELTAAGPGRWKVDGDGLQRPVRVWEQPDPDQVLDVHLDGFDHFFTTIRSRPSKLVSQADWSDDKTLLMRVLRDLRRIDRDYADAVGLTHQAVKRYAELLAAESAVADPQLAGQRMMRARSLMGRLLQRLELGDDVAQGILALPAAKAVVASGVEAARQDVRSGMELEIGEHTAQIQALESRRASLNAEIDDLRSRIEQRRSALVSEIEVLEDDMATRLAALSAQPLRILNDTLLARIAAHPFTQVLGVKGTGFQEAMSRTGHAAGAEAPAVEIPEALASLQQELVSQGFTKALSKILVAAFLSGLVPALRGSAAAGVLSAAARSLSSSRLTWIETPASAYRVADVLTTRDGSDSGPQPNDLLALLCETSSPEHVRMAVVSGANRAPIETYLSPLLQLRADGPTPGRRIEVGGTAGIDCWPSWLLLALTITDGSTVVPIPGHAWSYCIPISLEEFTAAAASAGTSAETVASSIKSTSYDEWRAKVANANTDSFRQLVSSLPNKGLDPSEVESGCRFFAALRLLGLKDQPALKYSAALCIGPRLSSRGEEYPDVPPFEQNIVKQTWALVRNVSM